MNNTTPQTNCLSFIYAHKLYKLCQPLLQNIKIDSFCYVRLYQDGSCISLDTNLKIENFMLTKHKGKFMPDIKIFDSIFNNREFFNSKHNNRTYLFTEDIDNGYWANMFKKFNIKSCFNIIDKYDTFYERFEFRNHLDKNCYSFYVNHLGVLGKFILYFKEHGYSLIKAGEKNKIVWLNNDPQYNKLVQNLKKNLPTKIKHIEISATYYKMKKYLITGEKNKIYITPRELECLKYLARGFSCKEIAKILWISYRTVELYAQRIKTKLGIHSRDKLLKIYYSSLLADLDK